MSDTSNTESTDTSTETEAPAAPDVQVNEPGGDVNVNTESGGESAGGDTSESTSTEV